MYGYCSNQSKCRLAEGFGQIPTKSPVTLCSCTYVYLYQTTGWARQGVLPSALLYSLNLSTTKSSVRITTAVELDNVCLLTHRYGVESPGAIFAKRAPHLSRRRVPHEIYGSVRVESQQQHGRQMTASSSAVGD